MPVSRMLSVAMLASLIFGCKTTTSGGDSGVASLDDQKAQVVQRVTARSNDQGASEYDLLSDGTLWRYNGQQWCQIGTSIVMVVAAAPADNVDYYTLAAATAGSTAATPVRNDNAGCSASPLFIFPFQVMVRDNGYYFSAITAAGTPATVLYVDADQTIKLAAGAGAASKELVSIDRSKSQGSVTGYRVLDCFGQAGKAFSTYLAIVEILTDAQEHQYIKIKGADPSQWTIDAAADVKSLANLDAYWSLRGVCQ